MNTIYSSGRKFVLSDFLVSHSQMLLRSHRRDVNDVNIDIIFFDTDYVQLPSIVKSINIFEINKSDYTSNELAKKIIVSEKKKIFALNIIDNLFYVVASGFIVYENNLAINETSLGVLSYRGRDKEIARSYSK